MDAVAVFILGIFYILHKKEEQEENDNIPIMANKTNIEEDDAFMVYVHLLLKK